MLVIHEPLVAFRRDEELAARPADHLLEQGSRRSFLLAGLRSRLCHRFFQRVVLLLVRQVLLELLLA